MSAGATFFGLDHLDRMRGDAGIVDGVPTASIRGWVKNKLRGGDELALFIESCSPAQLRMLIEAGQDALAALEEDIENQSGPGADDEHVIASREVNR